MPRLRALVVALLLTAVVACEDEATPNIPDPTPSPSAPSPSDSPSSSPTAQARTPEETVRAWVEARNQALQDGDTTVAEALGSDKCATCDNSLAPIRQVYAEGGFYDTEGWRLVGSPKTSRSDVKATVTTGIEYAAGRTVPAAGQPAVIYGVENHIVEFHLSKAEDRWLIEFIGYIS